ncbi:hypothetical protein P7C70_g1690, partial [Phenoliferia sp. Uapishka_3]
MLRIHGFYWAFPILATVFWSATLLGLLLWWIIDDHHKTYQIDEATVVFISDVGAAHRGLFIPGCALTWIFYSATLFAERWLRHLRRIPGALAVKDRWASIVAVFFGVIGGFALLLLSIFNAFEYSTAHWCLTAVFVVCVAISAAAQTLEIMWLERDHRDRKHLRRNAIWKLVIVAVAIAFAIVFGATYGACRHTQNADVAPQGRCNTVKSVSAACEWFIAFVFDVYLLTLALDLWPAHKTKGHTFDHSLIEADRANILHYHKDGRPGAPRKPGMVHIANDATPYAYGNTLRTQDEYRFDP